MRDINETNAADYARQVGLFPESAPVQAECLAGGVSNIVLLLRNEASGQEIVLKQAREKLRVAADWRSRLDRVWREVLALRTLATLLPAGTVPEVLFEDRENYLFAMTAAPRDHVVWKSELLAGRLAPGVAGALGSLLGVVHSQTWNGRNVSPVLRDRQVFDELRIDPYYRWIATRDPEMQPALQQLIDQTMTREDCLTLADFSPKNILLADGRIILLDFETAHVGDPAFDVGFFLTHLLLKSLHVSQIREALLHEIREFWSAYRREFSDPAIASAIETRTGAHLAACLLARVDGKSPVDYLTPEERPCVRRFARSLLPAPPENWPDFELAARGNLFERLP